MAPCARLPAEARLRRGREPPSPRRRPNPPCPPGRAEPAAACRLSSLAEEIEEADVTSQKSTKLNHALKYFFSKLFHC